MRKLCEKEKTQDWCELQRRLQSDCWVLSEPFCASGGSFLAERSTWNSFIRPRRAASVAQCFSQQYSTGSTSLSPHSAPSPACLRSVHHGISYPRPPTQPPGSSCECDDRSEWPRRTLLHPPPRRRRCCCHPHNANKQERDPFLPTVTQTWNPTPLFLPTPRGILHSIGGIPHPVWLTHARRERKDGLWKSWPYLYDS